MAVLGQYTRVLVNQFDLSGVSNSIQVQIGANALDATNFLSSAAEWITTPGDASIAHSGYFHGKTTGLEQALYNRFATESVVSALFGTSSTFCPAYVFGYGLTGQLNITAPADGLIAVDGQWNPGSGLGMLRGKRLDTGTISATGGRTGQDYGAAGTAGGYAWLHVTTITGAAVNATITVESDTVANFATAATEGTFTFSAVGGYQITLSGTINRYVRLNCTSLGGATSFAVTAIVAISGITYNLA